MRNRSSAIAITTNTKRRLSNEINGDNFNERDKQLKFCELMEGKLKDEGRIKPQKPFDAINIINLPTPQYLDIKKEYCSKDEKPILFHERAKVINYLDKAYIGDIESYSQEIDFQTFLSQFKNEEEIKNFDIQDFINVDLDKLSEIKEKCKKYIDIIQNFEDKKAEEAQNTLWFLCEKLKQINKCELNLQKVISHIDKVESVIFKNRVSIVNLNK